MLSVAAVVSGCGSHRLETALEPIEGAVGGSGGADGGAAGSLFMGGMDATAGAPSPKETEELVGPGDFAGSYMVGPIHSERFQVAGQPFSEAWRATMLEPPSSLWAGQLVVPVSKPIEKGQLLHVSFWLDCEAPGDDGSCYTQCIFERAAEPWEKSVVVVAGGGDRWTQKSEFFSAVEAYESGGSHLVFRLGYASQVIAIGGIELEAIDP